MTTLPVRIGYFRITKKLAAWACCGAVAVGAGCNSTIHNEVFGIEEVTVNAHTIIVEDCYRLGKQPAQVIEHVPGKAVYRFAPCRDADVLIKNEELIVNGRSYGMLNRGDTITISHGKVLVNQKAARAVARDLKPLGAQ